MDIFDFYKSVLVSSGFKASQLNFYCDHRGIYYCIPFNGDYFDIIMNEKVKSKNEAFLDILSQVHKNGQRLGAYNKANEIKNALNSF